MKSSFKVLMPILVIVFLILPLGSVHAQGPEVISAEVDRTTLSTDETLLLMVTLNASSILNAPRPALPGLQGFSIVSTSSSSQISIINGDISSLVVYTYRLQPHETGDLIIEPISVSVGGQTFSTQPIAVQVTQGNGASQSAPSAPAASQPVVSAAELAGQDLYVEAEVDDPTPYVGQQVVHTFRFYRAVNLWDQPQYEAPVFTGFWSEHQMDQQENQVQAAGRIYRVTEIRTILFPSMVGPVTIDPARLVIPGGFFSSGRTLQTKPVELNVQPLPPGAPEDFDGAVGQYSLTASLDSTQGKVNEPLTWRVTLNGWGNLTAAPDPGWPEMPGWRDFESQATVETQVADGRAMGSRTYERLLVPSAQGEFTIPGLRYVYFDPSTGEYQMLQTEPVGVSIAPGAAEVASPLPAATSKETVEQVATDIRHLKPVPTELSLNSRPVTESGLYWAAWAFPVLGAAGYFAWQRRQRYWELNVGRARSSQARKKARKALAQARKQKGDAYDAAGQILVTYLSDKLDRPLTGLTHQALAERLAENGVEPALIERVEVVLVSSELGRFAPGADDPDYAASLLKEVSTLLDALERVL